VAADAAGGLVTDIVVQEMAAAPDGSFDVRIDFGDQGGADVKVSMPSDAEAESLLAWYFEEHLRYPFLDEDLDQKAVHLVADYGRRLFEQVFAGEAGSGYRRMRDNGFEHCVLRIRGSAAFHELRWETLRDPDSDLALALRIPMARQDIRVPLRYPPPDPAPTLNILVVTARPFGSGDIGYRTISRPLMDAVGRARLPVTVDLVRPGTWEEFRAALRSASRDRGQGWYQVVHFDVHGSFGTAAEVTGADPADGTSGGRQGYLFFETGTDDESDAVSAAEVASVLAEHRVAVAVLNACQSAMQSGSEASLAQNLVAAGAPVAMGMAYAVTVTAMEQAMPVLYGRLVAGDDPVSAVWEARRQLHDRKSRRGYFDQDLDLEDWILPVVFGQRDSRLRLRPMTPEEHEAFYRRQAQVSVPPALEYGFVGRDLDLHALERLLLVEPQNNQVLVRGLAGTGKSALLTHAGWWWQRTGLVDQSFYYTYEQRAWTTEQIVHDIAERLLEPAEFERWEALRSRPARIGPITELLRSSRHLLVIDNAESITAGPASIPPSLAGPEREQLARFVAGLRGGRTLVMIGSREAESWLASTTFAGNVYELPGLDPQASSELLERILTKHGGSRWLTGTVEPEQRRALTDLVRALGGYPLPITAVMPQLATMSPAQVLAELRAGQGTADPGSVTHRAIEYSYGKLDPRLQKAILLLAPFTATIPVPLMDNYARILSRQDGAPPVDAADLTGAVDELRRVGLVSAHPAGIGGWMQIVPILPYFLRGRLRDDDALRDALDQAHLLSFAGFGVQLDEMLTGRDPRQQALGRDLVEADYANLTAAVGYGQRTGKLTLSIVRVLSHYLEQTQQADALRRLLENAITEQSPAEDLLLRWQLIDLHDLAGKAALEDLRLDDAQTHYTTELVLREKLSAEEIGTLGESAGHLAGIYHQLGMVALRKRNFEQAEQYYKKALDLKLKTGTRADAVSTYSELGRLASEQRRFEPAKQYFRQALEGARESGDRKGAAIVFHELGIIAFEQGDHEQAERYLQQSVIIALEFGDQRLASLSYHELGMNAQISGDLGLAEKHYRTALNIRLKTNDRYGTAMTYHQLGMVTEWQDRLEQAEQYHRLALDIFRDIGDQFGMGGSHHQLGIVAEKKRDFAPAREYYQQARRHFIEANDGHAVAGSSFQLGMVAHEEGRLDEADGWYKQALDGFLETDDQYNAAKAHDELGRIAQEQSRFEQAERSYRQAVDIYAGADDKSAAGMVRSRLALLALAQEKLEAFEQYFRQSMEAFQEAGIPADAPIVYRRIGERLSELGEHDDAVQVLVYAAIFERVTTGTWSADTLGRLRQEGALLTGTTLAEIISEIPPPELAEEMSAAIRENAPPGA
jgi:tetratricopeptide (TPR) repeat protein